MSFGFVVRSEKEFASFKKLLLAGIQDSGQYAIFHVISEQEKMMESQSITSISSTFSIAMN
jgi:hypothetical protein